MVESLIICSLLFLPSAASRWYMAYSALACTRRHHDDRYRDRPASPTAVTLTRALQAHCCYDSTVNEETHQTTVLTHHGEGLSPSRPLLQVRLELGLTHPHTDDRPVITIESPYSATSGTLFYSPAHSGSDSPHPRTCFLATISLFCLSISARISSGVFLPLTPGIITTAARQPAGTGASEPDPPPPPPTTKQRHPLNTLNSSTLPKPAIVMQALLTSGGGGLCVLLVVRDHGPLGHHLLVQADQVRLLHTPGSTAQESAWGY